MKRLLVSLAIVGLLVFAASWTASAAAPVSPTVTAIEPASAFNDIDTRVTITGADFAVDASVTPTATPAVTLGGTPLTDVTWVDTQTLTAVVPWSMDPGAYALTVVNPGGGTFTLPNAFIRLRFKLDDNNNRVANDLRLYSGNAPTSARPRLIVTYYVP